jgi:cytochrome P450
MAKSSRVKKSRHDYRFRPEPRWEEGRFVPPAPLPIEAGIDEWDQIDWGRYMLAASKNPLHGMTRRAIEGFDEVGTSKAWFFFTPTKPETLRETFVEKADALKHSSLRNAIMKPVLREGLLVSEGDQWRRDRRALAPLFTPRHVDGYSQTIADAAKTVLPDLLPEGEVAADAAFVELTYKVLSDAMFSGELDGGRQTNLREIDRFLNSMGKPDPLDFLAIPDWFPRPTRVGKMGAVKRLRANIFELASARRAKMAAGQDVPNDLLSLMLTEAEFTDEQLKDQLITFIAAGHETTSRALTWLFYLLSQDEAARERLEIEVDALDTSLPVKDWPDQLPWTKACFEESMRLYPPAPFLSRQLNRAETLGGHALPEDSIVFANLWMLHRHRKLWDQPDAFMPERFLPEARANIGRFQYLPFGLGPHVCIGARFAQLEGIVLTALVARQSRLSLSGEHPWPLARITVRPEKPLMMRIEKR